MSSNQVYSKLVQISSRYSSLTKDVRSSHSPLLHTTSSEDTAEGEVQVHEDGVRMDRLRALVSGYSNKVERVQSGSSAALLSTPPAIQQQENTTVTRRKRQRASLLKLVQGFSSKKEEVLSDSVSHIPLYSCLEDLPVIGESEPIVLGPSSSPSLSSSPESALSRPRASTLELDIASPVICKACHKVHDAPSNEGVVSEPEHGQGGQCSTTIVADDNHSLIKLRMSSYRHPGSTLLI